MIRDLYADALKILNKEGVLCSLHLLRKFKIDWETAISIFEKIVGACDNVKFYSNNIIYIIGRGMPHWDINTIPARVYKMKARLRKWKDVTKP